VGNAAIATKERQPAGSQSQTVGGSPEPSGETKSRSKTRLGMNVYLLLCDDDIREKPLLRFLDSRKEVVDWMTVLPASVLLVSRYSPRQLAKVLTVRFPKAQFMLTEVDGKLTDGMLPDECWKFINSHN
jgi:hypothetical protein